MKFNILSGLGYLLSCIEVYPMSTTSIVGTEISDNQIHIRACYLPSCAIEEHMRKSSFKCTVSTRRNVIAQVVPGTVYKTFADSQSDDLIKQLFGISV